MTKNLKVFLGNILYSISFWDSLTKFCLYSSILVIPILFLPWTNYQVAWNKQSFLVFFVFVAFISFLIKSIAKGEISYIKSPINLILIGLVVVTGISAWLVESQSLGVLGATGAEVDSFLSVVTFFLLFFLVANSALDERWIASLFLVSSFVVFVTGAMQLFNWWVFPWGFTKSITFNTIGTANALAIFLGFVFVTTFFTVYSKFSAGSGRKINFGFVLLSIFLVALFVLLGIFRFWIPFVGIGFAMIILIGLEFRNKKSFSGPMSLAFLVLVLSIFFALSNFLPSLNFSFLPSFPLPLEVTPSWSSSWSIAKDTMSEGWKNTLFGSGPSTFQYQYGLYRLAELNNSNFWSVRFVQGINAFMTNLVNIGTLGSVLLILFFLFLLAETARAFYNGHRLAIGLGLIYLILMIFLYPQNFVLYFFIFLLAALLIKTESRRERIISINDRPLKTFSFSLLMMILIMFSASTLYVQGQRYIGSIYFYNGLKSFTNEGNTDKAISNFLGALDFDSRNDFYLQNLAQVFMIKVNSIANQPATTEDGLQQLQAEFSSNLGAAIQSARRAVELNPNESQNWLVLGKVYEDVIILVPGAAEKAIESYNAALKLEPNNPMIVTALGRSRVLFAEFQNRNNNRKERDKEYAEAATILEKAVALKADYLPAHFLLAQVYDQQGRDRFVAMKINEISQIGAGDPAVFYQLGLFHYRASRFDSAKTYFEKAIELFPNYSNARYFLGLIYSNKGERNKAVEQFEKIAELNPGNDQIKEILNSFRSNKITPRNDQSSPELEEEPESKNDLQ